MEQKDMIQGIQGHIQDIKDKIQMIEDILEKVV